jgi:predicted P-loop ATPase
MAKKTQEADALGGAASASEGSSSEEQNSRRNSGNTRGKQGTRRRRRDINFADLMGDVARRLLGEPNVSMSDVEAGQLRFGAKGSLSVDTKKGTWFSHEDDEGGGVLALIRREEGLQTDAEATAWLRDEELIPDERPKANGSGKHATFVYCDETGAPLYRACRTDYADGRRKFAQERADGRGGWTTGRGCMKGARLVPYRLPELLADSGVVFAPEGEKHVDALRAWGLRATCNVGGAGKWRDAYSEHLRGADVVILPDNDDAGRNHADDVARSLRTVAARVRMLTLPDLPAKGDVIDWIAAGGTAEELRKLAETAPEWTASALAPVETKLPTVTWRDFKDKHGHPAPSLANAVIALKQLGIGCRLDLFHHAVMVDYRSGGREMQRFVGELTDHTIGAVRSLINNLLLLDVGDANTRAAVMEIARDHAFDPVLDYLTEAQGRWDGKKRIDTWLIDYCGAADTPLVRAIGRKHLVASVRRAREPGCKYDDILVLESPEGRNKSTAIAVLAGRENFSDQTILGVSDKEAQELVTGVWLYEIADLTDIARADVNRVKAFASRETDRARPAYGYVKENRPRRCTFWATTNDQLYLKSQTGNRRFLPVPVGRVALDALRRDRDQLWAEASVAEASGEAISLNETLWTTAAEEQESRRTIDPWEEILADIPETLDKGDPAGPTQIVWHEFGQERVASKDLLTCVLSIPPSHQTSTHWHRIASIMERLGWKRPDNKSGVMKINGKSARGYYREDQSEGP